MKKWNKSDTKFIKKSLVASIVAIILWSYFYSGQIYENYLNVSINEDEAKQKAMQYIGSRGWDVSGYTYSCLFSKSWGSQWWEHSKNQNYNYVKENATNKDLNRLRELEKLSGDNRWNMRWYNPPNTEEFQISYTKNGDLTFFHHIIPDSSLGDSLPNEIAYDIAKMFLKNNTLINWNENDWNLQTQWHRNEKNRMDHYFQWENKSHRFGHKHDDHIDNSTIRMSIIVKGSKVARYNRWLQNPDEIDEKFYSWTAINNFFDSIYKSLTWMVLFSSLLISLFYFKNKTNWVVAAKFGIVLFIAQIVKLFFEIPVNIYEYSSEDTLIGSIFNNGLSSLIDSLKIGFSVFFITAATEKLYRNLFPNALSFSSLFKSKSLTSKIFFNNYLAGIVFSFFILAFKAVYSYVISATGYYIAYPHIDFNHMLTFNPLIYLITSAISSSLEQVIIYSLLILIIYQISSSKPLSIFLSSLIVSFQGVLDVDPVYMGFIYIFIITLASGFMFFRYGILSLIIATFSTTIFSDFFLYLYTGETYYIITFMIIALLLFSTLIYCLLYYFKYGFVDSSKKLLNNAEAASEVKVTKITEHQFENIDKQYTKWALILFIIGMLCVLIPNNDEVSDIFKYKISKADALEKSAHTLEKDFNIDLSGYTQSITQNFTGHRSWTSLFNIAPFRFMQNNKLHSLSYISEKVGRSGIFELEKNYTYPFFTWMIKYFVPNQLGFYMTQVNSNNNDLIFLNQYMSDSLAMPSLSKEDGEKIAKEFLQKRNINFSGSIFHHYQNDHNVRIDQNFNYIDTLSIGDEYIITHPWVFIGGNKISGYGSYTEIDEEWMRDFDDWDLMYLITAWISAIIFIFASIYGVYYLIRNTYQNQNQITWKLIFWLIISTIFISITHFINMLPDKTWDYFSDVSWLAFWLEQIGYGLSDIPLLCIIIILPISCIYIINPFMGNLFSTLSRKDLFTSCLATFGTMLLYRPIKYILYALFPNYMDISTSRLALDYIKIDLLSAIIPGYELFLSIIVETLILFSFSLFFYHQYMDYSIKNKNVKKNIIILMTILFYIFYNALLESTVAMIPFFISKTSGVIIFLLLVKYFWKSNPLNHLFGILIYFQFDRILGFINMADPTLKYQGWILLVLFGGILIYVIGSEALRKRLKSIRA